MLKKIITGTLVLVVLSTSSVVVYADPTDKLYIDEKVQTEDGEIKKSSEEEKKEYVKIISPQIISGKDVITEKNLLISIKVLGEESVTLSLYKVSDDDSENLEAVLESEEIEPNDELESDYVKYVKNIKSGTYKMVFQKDGEEEPIEDIEFDVVVNEEKKDSLPNLLDLSITDLLLGE